MLPDNNPEIITKTKKTKGAQPGNTNALRHGFYARNLGNFSPTKYPEGEMRNLLGEAAMLKDYMYFLYSNNLGSTNSAVLTETLRALSLAGMSLARLLQVHKQVRIMGTPLPGDTDLNEFLSNLSSATSNANKYLRNINEVDDDDNDDE